MAGGHVLQWAARFFLVKNEKRPANCEGDKGRVATRLSIATKTTPDTTAPRAGREAGNVSAGSLASSVACLSGSLAVMFFWNAVRLLIKRTPSFLVAYNFWF
jgi:hypothetical protein